jgi:hypothetical protein
VALDLLPYLVASDAAGTGNTTLALTAGDGGGWPAVPGDTLIAFGGSGTAQPTGITDTAGNTWAKDAGTSTSPASSVWHTVAGQQADGSGLKGALAGYTADVVTIAYSSTGQAKQWVILGCQHLGALDVAATPATGTGTAVSISSGALAVAGELVAVGVMHQTGTTLPAPAGWHPIAANVTSGVNAVADVFVKIASGTGSVTFSGTLSSSVSWSAQLVSYRPALQDLRANVGASIFSGAYPGLSLSNQQAHNRWNSIMGGRQFNAIKRYSAEDRGAPATSSWGSSGNDVQSTVDWTTNQGCTCVVSIKPYRDPALGSNAAASLARMRNGLTYWKNNGITPLIVLGNEANIDGKSGPFGDGSSQNWDGPKGGPSPYGAVGSISAAQAAVNYLAWYGYYAPTVISAGLQAGYNPAISSVTPSSTFMPNRLDASGWPLCCGIHIDYYYSGDFAHNSIDMSTMISAANAMSPPCPVGIGEMGATDGSDRPLTDTPAGSRAGLVSWLDNQITAPLVAQLAAGHQLLPVIWFAAGTGNSIDFGQPGGVIAAVERMFDALNPGGTATITGTATLAAGFAVSAAPRATKTGAAVISPSFLVSTPAIPPPPTSTGGVPVNEWGLAMADSLVLAGQIELLGGGVPSPNPDCLGAMFRLLPGYDLSAPALTAEMAAGLLLDGEMITGMRASNRTPKLPVAIIVPPTGNLQADRATLAGARELLLRLAAQEHWTLTWAREGGYPITFDCQGMTSSTITYSTKLDMSLASLVEIEFSAYPYGRSEDPEQIQINTPSQIWDQPPAPVVLDNFTVATNYLTGDAAGFDATAADWTGAGNATVAWTNNQFRTGPGALAVTSSAAGNMQAASALAADYLTSMLSCKHGDTISISLFSRAGTVGRSVNVAAEYFDSLGNNLGVPARGSNVTNTTSGFTANPVFTGTAPAGAAAVRVNFQVVSAGGAGEVHFIDDVSINRGPVMSNVNPDEWSTSTVTPLTGQQSAYWSRQPSEHPIYDRTLPALADITGRAKFSFWAGYSSTAAMYHVWHKGTIHYSVTLTDSQGFTLSFGVKMKGQASALSNVPHWQHISIPIPQVSTGFDYTTIAAYHIEAWNTWDNHSQAPVLQASMFLAGVQAQATSAGAAATRSAWLSLPGIKGTARAPLAMQLAPGTSSFSSTALFGTAGVNTWVAPAGLTQIDKVECWGGGGGGAASRSDLNNGGGGGGGGEYAMDRNVPVTAGNTYHPVVGAGGQNGTIASSPTNDATSGASSYFVGDSGNQTTAHGGQYGFISVINEGGKGGSGSGDYLHHPGGQGFRANFRWNGTGGGGGSSGGPGADGNDASAEAGASAPTGGGAGGTGGARPNNDYNTGRDGARPGGGAGGGGLRLDGTIAGGGAGANGQIKLSYGATGIFPLGSFLVHMPQIDAPAALNPVCSVGNGADAPDGREYTFPAVSNLNARFDGTYTVFLIASAWNTPASSRTLTVQLRQYPFSGGTGLAAPALTRTVTPNTDITNGYVDMGAVTLPLADLPPGNTDAYFTVGVTSGNAADRFYDILLVDSQGQLVLVNMPGTAFVNLAWIDEADRDRDLGRVSGSDTDLNRARSLLQWTDRLSGGPLSVTPDQDNRILIYATQGVPAATAYYAPRWWTERLS